MISRRLGKVMGISGEIPEPQGPFKKVGVARFRPSNETPFVQMFYPAAVTSGRAKVKRVPYMRREAGFGVARFMGTRRAGFIISSSMSAIRHPFLFEAPLHKEFTPDNEEGKKLPVILFSHGLGGTSEVYSKICSDLASFGYIVLAMEHEDGSASYAQTADGKRRIYYTNPPKGFDVMDREPLLKFRQPFLKHRRGEVLRLIEFLHSTNGKRQENGPSEKKASRGPSSSKVFASEGTTFSPHSVLEAIDMANLFLGGHSFGGSTTFHCCHDELIRKHLKGTFMLDLWPGPNAQEHLDAGMPIESLSILTEFFAKHPGPNLVLEIVGNSDGNLHSFYIPGTTHQQYSDAPWFLGERLGKKVQACGSTPKDASQETIINAIVHYLEGKRDFSQVETNAPLLPFYPETEEEDNKYVPLL